MFEISLWQQGRMGRQEHMKRGGWPARTAIQWSSGEDSRQSSKLQRNSRFNRYKEGSIYKTGGGGAREGAIKDD